MAMTYQIIARLTLVTYLLFGGSDSLRGQSESEPQPFRESYLGLDLVRDFPISFGGRKLVPGKSTIRFSYRYNIDPKWFATISAHYRRLQRRTIDRPGQPHNLELFTLGHEIAYAIRLYHPTYLLPTWGMMYFLPVQRIRLPFLKDNSFDTEVGVAAKLSLLRIVSERVTLQLSVERWRGVNSNDYHGIEVALGTAYAL